MFTNNNYMEQLSYTIERRYKHLHIESLPAASSVEFTTWPKYEFIPGVGPLRGLKSKTK